VIERCTATETDMRLVGRHDLTASYVRTLQAWRSNFEAAEDRLDELGYDERFRRIWRLYLAYVEAGFAERRICDYQLLLAKPASVEPAGQLQRQPRHVDHGGVVDPVGGIGVPVVVGRGLEDGRKNGGLGQCHLARRFIDLFVLPAKVEAAPALA